MKKIPYILTLIIIFSQISVGQNNTEIIFGANFATFTGNDTYLANKNFRIGAKGGIMIEMPFKYASVLEIGGLYSQQGAVFNNTYFEYNKKVSYQIHYDIDYIQIPIIWKQYYSFIYTKIGGYTQIPIFAKGYWTMKHIYSYKEVDYSGNYNSFVNNLRSFDIGIVLGLGFSFTTKRGRTFFLDLNMTSGLFPVNKPDKINAVLMRNLVFSPAIGFLFEGDKKHRKRR